ncbi:phospholipase-like protein [Tanacetum coccineum]
MSECVKCIFEKIKRHLTQYLESIAYFEKRGSKKRKRAKPTLTHNPNTRTQKVESADSGVFVCLLMEKLAKGEKLLIDESSEWCTTFRDVMVEELCKDSSSTSSPCKSKPETGEDPSESNEESDASNGPDEHIQAWFNRIMRLRPKDARWTAMDIDFWGNLQKGMCAISHANGSGALPAWWDVERVFFPIQLKGDDHIMLGELNLNSWRLITYGTGSLEDDLNEEVFRKIQENIVKMLENINYFKELEKKNKKATEHVNVKLVLKRHHGDVEGLNCDVFACLYMENLLKGKLSEKQSLDLIGTTDEFRAFVSCGFRRIMARELANVRMDA